jgi:HTH-type transcriptional regulator/antitoxin HigA
MSKENERKPAEIFPPCELIEDELKARGWTRETLAREMDCSLKIVEETLAGKRRITLMMACMLSDAFGTSVQFWRNLQSSYDDFFKRKETS